MKIPNSLLCLLLLAATPVLAAVQQPLDNDPQYITIAEEEFKQLEEKMRVAEEDFNKLEKSMHDLQDTFAAINFKQQHYGAFQRESLERFLKDFFTSDEEIESLKASEGAFRVDFKDT